MLLKSMLGSSFRKKEENGTLSSLKRLPDDDGQRRRGFHFLRRAISPLVASILLIAFTVTLGALVMSWSQKFVQDNADTARGSGDLEISCQISTALGIKTVGGSKRICYSNISDVATLSFTLENKGSDTIDGIKVVLIGVNDSSSTTDLTDFEISGGNIKKGNVSFNFTTLGETVVEADFIPYVTTDSTVGSQLCRNLNIQEDGIFACS